MLELNENTYNGTENNLIRTGYIVIDLVNGMKCTDDKDEHSDIYVAKIIKRSDTTSLQSDFTAAKRDEFNSLRI